MNAIFSSPASFISEQQKNFRGIVVLVLDACATALSIFIALYLRVGSYASQKMIDGLTEAMLVSLVSSAAIFYMLGLHRRIWRYTSVSDILRVAEAITLAIAFLIIILLLTGRAGWMPRSLPLIQWFVLIVLMGGARVSRRLLFEFTRAAPRWPQGEQAGRSEKRALLVGSSDRVDMVLRLLEANPDAGFKPVGILCSEGAQIHLRVRGVPVMGSIDLLEHVVKQLETRGARPEYLITADEAGSLHGPAMVRVVTEAESLGLKVACLPKLAESAGAAQGDLDLRFINVAELLGRPQARLEVGVVERAIADRRVLVTGAGGTIGRELVRQIAAFGPRQLILLESCEFNLYDVDLELRENYPHLERVPVLCSVRQRRQVMQVFADHRPDLVFHAAALKHVPLVEQHPCAGVQTNVLGTRNVADAALRYHVRAMIQVSTDKAVNPVGMMGATKRLGELYCQALDLEGQLSGDSPRFLTVRFGNVLGSSGSLIPLFQHQLSRGKSLTVTHPDIRRYFMTVHEAVQLILQSTARGLEGEIRRGRIFVLDMGEPIKIMDIARRMLRLAGLDPDRDGMIDVIGLRPGEKLYEELFDAEERRLPSTVEGLFEAEPMPIALGVLKDRFDALAAAALDNDAEAVRAIIAALLRQESVVAPRSPGFIAAPALAAASGGVRQVAESPNGKLGFD